MRTADVHAVIGTALVVALAAACNAGELASTATTGTTDASTTDASTTASAPTTGEATPACVDTPACPCGTLGCACDAGTCSDGACSPDTGTCVEEHAGMMHVPAGPFWMGCREGIDTDARTGPCPATQLPYREVTVSSYWIDRTEVTKGAYRECMDAGACTAPPRWDAEWYMGEEGSGVFVPGSDDMPVASVTWTQAREYCAWNGKRLPTDAEWEKAARGVDGRKYPWGMDEPTCERANFRPWDIAGEQPGPECPYRATYQMMTPVGMFCGPGASVYGLCDMAGNVLEWVADGYDLAGYEGLPAEDPVRTPNGGRVVRRGAGWGAFTLSPGGYSLRASMRQGGGTDDPMETLETGFRCAAPAA